MKLFTKLVLPGLLFCLLILQGCASLSSMVGLSTKPSSLESSLFYGYIDINQEKNAYTQMIFVPMEIKKKRIALAQGKLKLNYFQKKAFENEYNAISQKAYIKQGTGSFAVEIKKPVDLVLDSIVVINTGLQTSDSGKSYTFDTNVDDNDIIRIGTGEVSYYGAVSLQPAKYGLANLEPHMKMAREDVLDQVVDILEGKGWEEWLSRERANL